MSGIRQKTFTQIFIGCIVLLGCSKDHPVRHEFNVSVTPKGVGNMSSSETNFEYVVEESVTMISSQGSYDQYWSNPRCIEYPLNFSLISHIDHTLERPIFGTYTLANSKYYSIKKFVDGDTFWIDDGTAKGEKIRFIGIDAPESRKVFKKPKQYVGTESKAYVKYLLTGKKVRLEYDVDRFDRFGRTLAYIFLEDGTFLNAKLIKEGYAQVMTIPPNVKYVDLFIQLQMEARENHKGLWKID